jgi:hypothetical protein
VRRAGLLRGQLFGRRALELLHGRSAGERTRLSYLETVGPAAALAQAEERFSGGVVLRAPSGMRSLPRSGIVVPDAEGRFAFESVPAGRWQLFLRCRENEGLFELPRPLAEFELRAGEERELRVELGAVLEPGTLRGTLRQDDVACGHATVRIWNEDRNGVRREAARVQTDASGVFAAVGLLPLRYSFGVVLPHAAGALPLSEDCVVEPGQTMLVDLRFATRAVLLPWAMEDLELRRPGLRIPPDSVVAGLARFAAVPLGTYGVHRAGRPAREVLGEVLVEAGEGPIRIPPPGK